MKKKDLSGLRSKTKKELEKLAGKKTLEIAKTRASVKAGQEKNLKKVKQIRHEASQVLTVLKEKEIVEKIKGKEAKKIQPEKSENDRKEVKKTERRTKKQK
jgi:ribosomal protein L29